MTEWLHFHVSLSWIGEGNGSPLQCSCLENPRDGGAWWAAVSGVAQSQTQLKRLSSRSSREHPCFWLFRNDSYTVLIFLILTWCFHYASLVYNESISTMYNYKQIHKTSVVWQKYGSFRFYEIKVRKQLCQVHLSKYHQLLYFFSRIFHFSNWGWDRKDRA